MAVAGNKMCVLCQAAQKYCPISGQFVSQMRALWPKNEQLQATGDSCASVVVFLFPLPCRLRCCTGIVVLHAVDPCASCDRVEQNCGPQRRHRALDRVMVVVRNNDARSTHHRGQRAPTQLGRSNSKKKNVL